MNRQPLALHLAPHAFATPRGASLALLALVAACTPEPASTPSEPPHEEPAVATTVTPTNGGAAPAPRDTGALNVGGMEQPLTLTQSLRMPEATCRSFRSAGVTAVDYDGDDHNDVAAALCDKVYLWRGRGDGAFDDPTILTVGADPSTFAYGVWFWDFDRDGLPELLYPGTDGLRVLSNRGGGAFEDGPRWGLAERTGLAASINFTDLNGDGLADLFLGNTSIDLLEMLMTGDFRLRPEMRDEVYLQSPEGTFAALPVPENFSWFTLHSVPFEGGVLALSDFASSSVGSAWYRVEGAEVLAENASVWINPIEAPMGGMLTWFEGQEQLFSSDSQPVHVFVRSEGLWFERADLRAPFPTAYSWSVLPLERLRAEATVVVTYGGFPATITSPNPSPRADSVRLFDLVDGVYEQTILFDQGSFIGATAADFDSDGLPELIARQTLDDGSTALRLWSAKSAAARVLLALDASCVDAIVSTANRRANFLPYTNGGSFGHGPLALTLPWPDDGVVTVEAHGRIQTLRVEPNRRVDIACNAP
jgi:hypothetical protein